MLYDEMNNLISAKFLRNVRSEGRAQAELLRESAAILDVVRMFINFLLYLQANDAILKIYYIENNSKENIPWIKLTLT